MELLHFAKSIDGARNLSILLTCAIWCYYQAAAKFFSLTMWGNCFAMQFTFHQASLIHSLLFLFFFFSKRNETILWFFFLKKINQPPNVRQLHYYVTHTIFISSIFFFFFCSLPHFFFKIMRQYHDCLNITTWPLLPPFF